MKNLNVILATILFAAFTLGTTKQYKHKHQPTYLHSDLSPEENPYND